MHVFLCTPIHMVPTEARRECQITQCWNSRWFQAAMWVPRTEPGSSGRVASASLSPEPSLHTPSFNGAGYMPSKITPRQERIHSEIPEAVSSDMLDTLKRQPWETASPMPGNLSSQVWLTCYTNMKHWARG